jgi:hypothetical protein
MKKINIRSPYKIIIDEAGQDGSKIELFFWNKGTTEPTIAQHIQSKKKVSNFQTANEYNISEFAKEYIKPIAPVEVTTPTEENANTWCYMKVKRYKLISGTYTLVDTETFVCLNGFTNYEEGWNQSRTEQAFVLSNPNIKRLQELNNKHYVNVWIEVPNPISFSYNGVSFTPPSTGLYKFPLINGSNDLTDVFIINIENKCEPIYEPLILSFINRLGGWEFITMFKNRVNTFSSNSEDYKLLPSQSNYNPLQGQKRKFNQSLNKKVKINTGFVPEDYSELIQDMMVSDVLLLDNKPVNLVATSFEEKTTLNNNNINYEFEFEYAYNLINDVI